MTKICKHCSAEFTPKSKKHVFCTSTCKGKHKYVCGSLTTEGQYKQISGNWSRYASRLMMSNGRKRDGLTTQIILDLLEEQDYCCALTGVPLTCQLEVGVDFKTNASLDRIEAGGPYIKSNVQLVCKAVNSFRGNLSIEEFKWWCKKVVENG
jgi:hypothetical protein